MKCNDASGRCTCLVRFGLFVMFILGGVPAMAQTEFGAEAYHKQDLKYALLEAREVESGYDQTHLDLKNRNFKKGEAARKRVKVKGDRNYYKETGRSTSVLRSKRNKRKFAKTKNKGRH